MTAPAPSPDEQAVIERFGIFDEERVVEEVARALTAPMPEWRGGPDAAYWRMRAVAAVAAYRATDGGAKEAPPLGAPDESARVARAQADNGSGDWLGGPVG